MNFLTLVLPFLEKIIPDPKARAAAQAEALRLQQAGQMAELDASVKLAVGQMDVNKTEAANSSMFVAGWRPWIGWVCGTALGYQFLLHPLLCWLSLAQGWPVPPRLDMDTLLTLLTGMLGLAGLRTGEKFKGVAR
jgi:hypothetical protein